MSSQTGPTEPNVSEILQVEKNKAVHQSPEQGTPDHSSENKETLGAYADHEPSTLSGNVDYYPEDPTKITSSVDTGESESTNPKIDDNEEEDEDEDEEEEDEEEEEEDDFPRFEDATPRGRMVSSVSGQKPPKPKPK